jgi:hypothetical protein
MAAVSLAASAEMPFVDKTRQAFDSVLTETKCFFGFSLLMPRLAADLAAQATKMDKGRERLIAACQSCEMDLLLHSIKPDMMRSLVHETVAYDFQEDRPSPPETYPGQLADTYVAALSIEGRGGEFLTRLEIAELVKSLELYFHAYRYYAVHGKWDNTPVCTAYKTTVADIEGKHFKGGAPILIASVRASQMAGRLVDMFKKRDRPDLDPTGDTPQK